MSTSEPIPGAVPKATAEMNPGATLARVNAALADFNTEQEQSADGMPSFSVERQELHACLAALRDDAQFDALTFITAIDRFGGRRPEPRFEVVYQLQSIEHADRVRLRVRLHSDDAKVPSCTDLWSGANYMERECYDLMGIHFDDHPDLRRLMMPEGYGHHPLRKEFPHQGIEPDRLYREWDRARRKEWDADRAASQQGDAKS